MSPSGSINKNDNNMEDISFDETEQQHQSDPWDSFTGYTPLADLAQNSTVMLSAGPEIGGAFYADMSAFTYIGDDDDEDDNNSDTVKETKDEEDINYLAVADQALRALDEEYRLTVQSAADRLAGESMDEPLPPIRLAKEDFGAAYFNAKFDDTRSESVPVDQKELPSIDTEAVRRAVGAIRLIDSKLNQNFADWEARQKAMAIVAPKTHPLIPVRHLKSFRARDTNAVQTTHILSRAATIADALVKLDLLSGQDHLQIDIVGCDQVECASEERLRQLFGPLARWISESGDRCPKKLHFQLIGPNVPTNAPRHLELAPCGGLQSIVLSCQSCVYEDRTRSERATRLLVSFHAGIWGYNEWRPTLEYLARLRQKVFFIVTAYTLLEAEEDAEVIHDVLSKTWHVSKDDLIKSECVWEPQKNAFASKQTRETASAARGQVYRENAAWQAWCI